MEVCALLCFLDWALFHEYIHFVLVTIYNICYKVLKSWHLIAEGIFVI